MLPNLLVQGKRFITSILKQKVQSNLVPGGDQQQTLCIDSLVLHSCQSMHREGHHRQIRFQFQQLHAQFDEPFVYSIAFAYNWTTELVKSHNVMSIKPFPPTTTDRRGKKRICGGQVMCIS